MADINILKRSKVRVLILIGCTVILILIGHSNLTWYSNQRKPHRRHKEQGASYGVGIHHHTRLTKQTEVDPGGVGTQQKANVTADYMLNSVPRDFENDATIRMREVVNSELVQTEDKVDYNLYLDPEVEQRFRQRRDHLTKLCKDPAFAKTGGILMK